METNVQLWYFKNYRDAVLNDVNTPDTAYYRGVLWGLRNSYAKITGSSLEIDLKTWAATKATVGELSDKYWLIYFDCNTPEKCREKASE